MVRNGALSGAAMSGADAAVRGEDVVPAATVGGIIGGAAGPVGKGVGKVVSAVADRFNPAAATPGNVVNVAGVDVPLSQSQITQNPALSAEEQVLLRGGRGEPAQARAQAFKDLQDARVTEAGDQIAAGLDPTGTAARTTPNEAAERIAAELIAQEQAQQAAAAGVHAGPMSPAQQRVDMARSIGGGQIRAAAPVDAAEVLSDRFAAARDAAKADYRGKYADVAAAPGEFAPGSASGFRADVDAGLLAGDNPVRLDATNTPKSLRGLEIIDDSLNAAGPGVRAPAAPGAPAAVVDEHARNVADIRAKFGDDVAAAYNRQKAAAVPAPAAPKAQSLLEFIASKGGLGPDAELAAIGGEGHTVNVEGVGRRKLVRQGGWPLDYAREAAEEAGYLRGNHGGTSTVNDLLDAIDAEMRGQKRYPEGFEGHIGKRETAARSEREQHEFDAHMRGIDEDLNAAGYGQLGGDVRQRAAKIMADEGATADDAVERAFHQLEQEDAAALSRGSDFPGDRPAAPAPQPAGAPFTMRDVEQVRKQLSTLYGDARRAMIAGGSGADLHALEHITDQFDQRVAQMVEQGKFSGDGPAVLQMQEAARASFADYKQKFAKRGAGDTVGAAVEKILGKFADTKATPDEIVKLAYGSGSAPGGQMPVQIAQRIERIFGRNSEEFATYKQGLFAHLTAGEPEEAAARIGEFLNGTKGRLLAHTVFDAGERAQLARYADRLRGTIPQPNEPGAIAATLRRYSGADGAPPASANKIINDLMGATGKGNGVNAPLIASALKQRLSPEGWTSLRQGVWEKLTNAGEGKIPYEAQALSQRLHEFLNGAGSQLAGVLYTDQERALMKQLAAVYKQMIPVKGTTNPSGTAPMLARIANGARSSLLPLLGFNTAGLPGAAVALGIDKGLGRIANANQARKATELFFGDQPRRAVDPRFATGAGIAGRGLFSIEDQRRRSSR
ncbi:MULTISPECIES: hypothetical protein [unclassified Bradyrhizobium]|uniref:hypothetical protein n=1 Tax=unclassified Bradyrhizobium TaxID=2631580 RepID=UPI001BAAC8A0|nr:MULTISPECIES: hypothetical protein [unclassified Bradyrhizobium]MBR1206620.1 hypothetical protein [Bradyrhizobium sp. AUGA SZCCT0124]MBR1315402.1 hypothetical protein [Bradyrhizobium sp. AUGA SZCCT0051]MBR1338536.1 hypothetical protein [Bradyrhizobium sp. AUGA SZCCT0105]MBR1356191.1 hypothetical protein [Bradyrhizobium sp. AUGA SZCCT0045]